MVAATSQNFLPALAITFNHRSEAMFRAISRAEGKGNPYVEKALQTGLENVRLLSSKTPLEVRSILCQLHNTYHDGAGETWTTLLDRSDEIMAEWDMKVNGPGGTGITTRNSQYDSFLEKFVFREKQAVGWGDSLNFFRTTSVLSRYLTRYNIKEDVRQWCNTNMNFTDFKLSNRPQCWGVADSRTNDGQRGQERERESESKRQNKPRTKIDQ